MDRLIPVINQLQEVFSTSGWTHGFIPLPQIIVVGEQSAGKSSVLESLVGRPCLPRGKGIVTRCPIILQLIQTQRENDEEVADVDGEDVDEFDYCVFPHLPHDQNMIEDFDRVVQIINDQVDRNAGVNKGIIKDELIMKIHSPNVLSLTVVDLPGMVKNPVGDQPADIEKQVEDLIRSYIKNPNSIILAVSAATNDIANSASIKLAKEVDPELDRTVVVITKLDLMDAGTDAMEVLSGQALRVKLGIVGVVNRSFEDIQKNKTITHSIDKESKFLRKHYSRISHMHGTPFLRTKLQTLLLLHIKNCLPKLQERVENMIQNAREERKKLGEDVSTDSAARSVTLRKILQKFCDQFKPEINGRKLKLRQIEHIKFSRSARIKQIFEGGLSKKLNSVTDPMVNLTDDMITKAIANCRAIESSAAVPEVAFQDLTRGEIRRLENPALECVREVYIEIQEIIDECMEAISFEVHRFPKTRAAIFEVVSELLQMHFDEAKQKLKEYVMFQASYVTTQQSEFNDEIKEFQPFEFKPELSQSATETLFGKPGNPSFSFGVPSQNNNIKVPPKLNDVQARRCTTMKNLVSKYFNVAKADVRNYWPKVIYKTLIDSTEKEIHESLLSKLHISEVIDKIIVENATVVERRRQLSQQLTELQKAKRILASIKETSI